MLNSPESTYFLSTLHIEPNMFIYLLVACDRLEEAQEEKLKANLPEIQAALQKFVDDNNHAKATLINDCESEYPEDWQLGISQSAKKKIHLKDPIQFFNDLAKKFAIDCEIGSLDGEVREPVSYFGHEEGKGDSFMIGEYLGL